MSERTIESQRAITWSLLLCLWIAILPLESGIIYRFCADGRWDWALMAKSAAITIVLAPIAVTWAWHRSFDWQVLRSGRFIILAIVIGIKVVMDGSAIIRAM